MTWAIVVGFVALLLLERIGEVRRRIEFRRMPEKGSWWIYGRSADHLVYVEHIFVDGVWPIQVGYSTNYDGIQPTHIVVTWEEWKRWAREPDASWVGRIQAVVEAKIKFEQARRQERRELLGGLNSEKILDVVHQINPPSFGGDR